MNGRWRLVVAPALAALLLAALATPSQAAFPGQNGKIAFQQSLFQAADIHSMNADGSGDTAITSSPALDALPTWSPDGTKIAFESTRDDPNPASCTSVPECNYEIYTMNADGSGVTRLTNRAGFDRVPTWSPDGSKILFWSSRNGGGLHVMNADGTGVALLHAGGFWSRWSPDGQKIAFQDFQAGSTLYVMDADGSNVTPIAQTDEMSGLDWSPDGQRIVWSEFVQGQFEDYGRIWSIHPDGTQQTELVGPDALHQTPAWSPDGQKIAFSSYRGSNSPQIWVMNSDGTSQTQVTPSGTAVKVSPDWQPIPINSYPRPKGATPFLTYLVPAYNACASPNRQHGPPLAFPSCNPPTQSSNTLTIGSADSNGKPTKSVSSVGFDTLVGIPSTTADEADVKITAQVIDVYTQAGLNDYAGERTVTTPLRITDKLNTPHPGGPGAGTVSDIPYGFTIPCAATADTTIGGSCLLSTSADALAPGAVKEGKRSIWALGQVAVYDANDAPFMKQGIFVP
jgi:hypothetical protein